MTAIATPTSFIGWQAEMASAMTCSRALRGSGSPCAKETRGQPNMRTRKATTFLMNLSPFSADAEPVGLGARDNKAPLVSRDRREFGRGSCNIELLRSASGRRPSGQVSWLTVLRRDLPLLRGLVVLG